MTEEYQRLISKFELLSIEFSEKVRAARAKLQQAIESILTYEQLSEAVESVRSHADLLVNEALAEIEKVEKEIFMLYAPI